MENQVTQAVPAPVITQVLAKTDEIIALLRPYLISLTPQQREEMPKMGDKSIAFVQKAAEYSLALDNYVPDYIDTPALRVDAEVHRALLPVYQNLLGLVTDIESTRMQAGSEGYSSALLVYAALQAAAKANQAGAQAAVQELEPRFSSQGKRKAKPATA